MPGAARLNDVWWCAERVLVGIEGMLARIFGKPPCKLKSTLLHFVLGETLGRYELSGKLRHLLPEMKLDALILLKFNVERRPGGAVSLQLWFRIFTITRGLSTATSLGLCHLVDQMGMPDSTEFYRHSECKRCIRSSSFLCFLHPRRAWFDLSV